MDLVEETITFLACAAKCFLYGQSFNFIIKFCGGTVRIDIIYLFGINLRVFHAPMSLPGSALPVGIRRSNMISIAGHPKTDNLSKNIGISFLGMLQRSPTPPTRILQP